MAGGTRFLGGRRMRIRRYPVRGRRRGEESELAFFSYDYYM